MGHRSDVRGHLVMGVDYEGQVYTNAVSPSET